jgi:hypothetical protein
MYAPLTFYMFRVQPACRPQLNAALIYELNGKSVELAAFISLN